MHVRKFRSNHADLVLFLRFRLEFTILSTPKVVQFQVVIIAISFGCEPETVRVAMLW